MRFPMNTDPCTLHASHQRILTWLDDGLCALYTGPACEHFGNPLQAPVPKHRAATTLYKVAVLRFAALRCALLRCAAVHAVLYRAGKSTTGLVASVSTMAHLQPQHSGFQWKVKLGICAQKPWQLQPWWLPRQASLRSWGGTFLHHEGTWRGLAEARATKASVPL